MAALTSAASVVEMEEPMCLVKNHAGQGLAVRQDALQVLANITQPVVVVAIAGLYRSGKSYLMNRLAGRRTGEGRAGMGIADAVRPCFGDSPPLRFVPHAGFSLGSSVQAHTKGIWMWCVPHPLQPGHTLLLLDTEGLGDVEKVGEKQHLPSTQPHCTQSCGQSCLLRLQHRSAEGSGAWVSSHPSSWPSELRAQGFAAPLRCCAGGGHSAVCIAGRHQERHVDLRAGRAALQHPDLQQQGHHRPAGPGEPAVSLVAVGVPRFVPVGRWVLHDRAPPRAAFCGASTPPWCTGAARGAALQAEPSSHFPYPAPQLRADAGRVREADKEPRGERSPGTCCRWVGPIPPSLCVGCAGFHAAVGGGRAGDL